VSWSLRIGRAFGIPIRLHVTMLILPFLFFPGYSEAGLFGWAVGAALIVLLFGSVLLHELGHSLVARVYGVRTEDIVLTPIGGLARIVNMPRSPRQEILIAAAGPAVSLLIAAVAWLGAPLLTALGGRWFGLALGQLVEVNVMLGLFNLIPALPLDGGRVLRGLLATHTDHLTATRRAARVGRVLAVAGGLASIFWLDSWSLALIALFVWIAAGNEVRLAWYQELQRQQTNAPGPDGWLDPTAAARRDARDIVVVDAGPAEILERRDPPNRKP